MISISTLYYFCDINIGTQRLKNKPEYRSKRNKELGSHINHITQAEYRSGNLSNPGYRGDKAKVTTPHEGLINLVSS